MATPRMATARKKRPFDQWLNGPYVFTCGPASTNRGGTSWRKSEFTSSCSALGGRSRRRGCCGSRSGGSFGSSGGGFVTLHATAIAGATIAATIATTTAATTTTVARVLTMATIAVATTATVATVTMMSTATAAMASAIATIAAASAAQGGRGIASADQGEANNREENRDTKYNNSVHSGNPPIRLTGTVSVKTHCRQLMASLRDGGSSEVRPKSILRAFAPWHPTESLLRIFAGCEGYSENTG